MPLQQTRAQSRPMVHSASNGTSPAPSDAATRTIPYDYVAVLGPLTGVRGNRHQDVVNISIDGAFVAVAVGYSFIPSGALTIAPAINGIAGLEEYLPLLAKSLLLRIVGIDFKYSLTDSGVGRELQNRPVHNIAGWGRGDGDRPFRPLATPILFTPRSTIRVEIEEMSPGDLYANGELHIVLHGYKMLGYGTGLP
jgi:hypothetical protein